MQPSLALPEFGCSATIRPDGGVDLNFPWPIGVRTITEAEMEQLQNWYNANKPKEVKNV